MSTHQHSTVPSDPELRVKALESLLVEKGLVDPKTLEELVDLYETKIGPRNGAKVVAKAWKDPEFKKYLLEKPTDAIASLGYRGRQGEHMRVVENTADIHNIVVCTLCSCYPWPVLGLPPVWYKSAPYRSRVVSDPRPEAPTDFQNKSLDELESMVTRNSMIGVEKIKDPEIRS